MFSSSARRIIVPAWRPLTRRTWAPTKSSCRLQGHLRRHGTAGPSPREVKLLGPRGRHAVGSPRVAAEMIADMGDDYFKHIRSVVWRLSTKLVRRLGQSVHVLRIARSGTAETTRSRMQRTTRTWRTARSAWTRRTEAWMTMATAAWTRMATA
eukprot:4359513-Pleurochrysis_carterae.AAC.1